MLCSVFISFASNCSFMIQAIGLLYAMISQAKARTITFVHSLLNDIMWLVFSNHIISKGGQKVNLSADSKEESILLKQTSVKKSLTVKDLVTVGVFSAPFPVFALVGGIFLCTESGTDLLYIGGQRIALRNRVSADDG